MNLMPLAEKLESDGLGVMAETIFINMIPVEAPQGILLRNNLRGTEIDYELPGYYKTDFQVIVRAPNYPAGDALIAEVCNALTLVEQQLGPLYLKFMRPKTKPVVFPLSAGNLLEFSVEFSVAYTE